MNYRYRVRFVRYLIYCLVELANGPGAPNAHLYAKYAPNITHIGDKIIVIVVVLYSPSFFILLYMSMQSNCVLSYINASEMS